MSKLTGRSLARGSNPFYAAKLRREVEAKGLSICDKSWTSLDGEPHKCSRVFSHRANHVCACGATRKLDERKQAKS